MKQVLVTGGAGFIGSHLCEALLARGDSVTVVDDISTGSLENLDTLRGNDRLNVIQGDVGDPDLVRKLVADVDEVYHLAAAVGVALIASEPIQTIERNIEPTHLLLTELRNRCQQGATVKFFLASTSEVYGKNPKPTWNEEDDLVFGATTKARWSYGASKAIDEFLALAYSRQFGLPVVIGRFFNVVGARQSGAYGMVLPRFVEAALAGKSLIVHDDGQQIRCFSHVKDVITAVIALMETPQAIGRVFNIGSDHPVSILELAQQVASAVEPAVEIEFQSYADAYDEDFEDIRRRVPDLTRLKETIAHNPQYDLDGIIREVIQSKSK